MNWKHAANYVAKRYMEQVPRNVYFDDVRLQMDAKLWGEEYNRYNPPKKVCFIFVIIIVLFNIPLLECQNTRWYQNQSFPENLKQVQKEKKNLSRRQQIRLKGTSVCGFGACPPSIGGGGIQGILVIQF